MIKFDENSDYKLTKIGVKDETKSRMVHQGDSIKGFATLQDNNCLMVTRGFEYIRTTPVIKVEDQGNGNFLVETVNSFYSLEKINNEET